MRHKTTGNIAATIFAIPLLVASSCTYAATPDAKVMGDYGSDMGRAQRCGVAIAEILLFAQLAKDLAQKGNSPETLNAAFSSAAATARDAAATPDCKAATERFDKATEELYKKTGR